MLLMRLTDCHNHHNAIIYDSGLIKPLSTDEFEQNISEDCDWNSELLRPCLIELPKLCRKAIVFPFRFLERARYRTIIHINVHLKSGDPKIAWEELSVVLAFIKNYPEHDFIIAGDFNLKFGPYSCRLKSLLCKETILNEPSEVVSLLKSRKLIIPLLRECNQDLPGSYECQIMDQPSFRPVNLNFPSVGSASKYNMIFHRGASDHWYLFTHIRFKPQTKSYKSRTESSHADSIFKKYPNLIE